jgi:cell division transport system ATP-binding protein
MIRIYNTTLVTDEKVRLERINLEIKKGEFVFLVGPTGAGKSTLLKLIYMEEFPTEGQIIVGEYDSVKMKSKNIPYLRRKLGMVFQDFRLLPDRDIFENVAFAMRVTGARSKDIKKQVLYVLAEVGLNHKRSNYPNELSGGEQQRVAIARALVNEPYILLADEPTGNLDPDASGDILNLLKRINARGTAVLMATHNYELIRKNPQRTIRIEDGKIVSDGVFI